MWQDLFTIGSPPTVGEWTEYALLPPLLSSPRGFLWVRLVGPHCGDYGEKNGVECRCDVAEIEWHEGWEEGPLGGGEGLSALEGGERCFWVDEEDVRVKLMRVLCADFY